MKKHIALFLILLFGFISYSQEPQGPIILHANPPDRQKITEFEKRNDSLVISLENSGTNKVYIGDLRTDISGKANINSPTFTGNVSVPTATISDAAVNLGQMMDSLATIEVSASGITSQYMNTDKTLEQSDFGKYIYTDTSIELTIDNTPAVSSKIGLKVIDIDSTITVIPDGVTFQGDGQDISQGFIVDSLNLATVFKLASNLYAVDGVYKPFVPPSNLYTLSNAVNPDNEVNATTGAFGETNWTVSSVSSSPSPQNGTHSLLWTHGGPDNTARGGYIDLSSLGLTEGNTYTITMYVNRVAGGNFTVNLQSSTGWTSTVGEDINAGTDPTPGVWREISLTGTRSAYASPRLSISANSNADTGNAIAVDNIRIYLIE